MKKRIFAQIAALVVAFTVLSGCGINVGNSGFGSTRTDPQAQTITVSEGEGQVVSLLQTPAADYVKAMKNVVIKGNDYCFNDEAGKGVEVADFWNKNTNVSQANVVRLKWKATKAPYNVYLATNSSFDEAHEYFTNANEIIVSNLRMATTYFWKVKNASGEENKTSYFSTEDTVRAMETGYVNNVRDLGGRMTSSGKRVKQGIIYRGAEMNIQSYKDENGGFHAINLRKRELDTLKNDLKIGTEIDFRTDAETLSMTESPLGDEVSYYRYPIASYTGMFCKHSNGSDKPEMRDYYQKTLRLLATATEDNAAYFHCWGGADRTGTIGFLINGLLGVSYTDLLIDFEMTTFSNNYRMRRDDPDNYNYFESMVNELIANYRKSEDETISTVVERYMRECLKLTEADITALKTNLIED